MPATNEEARQRMLAMGLNPDEWDESPLAPPAPPAAPAPVAPAPSSALGAGLRQAGKGLVPSLGAAGLGTVGAEVGSALGPLGTLGGAAVGGLLGSYLGSKGQDLAAKTLAPEFSRKMDEQTAKDEAEHPLASTIGGIASAAPFFEVNPGAAIKGVSKIPSLIRGTATPLEASLAKAAAINLGMGAGQGALVPLLSGQTPTWGDVGTGFGQAMLFGQTRPWLHSLSGMPPVPNLTPEPAALEPSLARNPIALLPFETPSTRRARVEQAMRGTVEPPYGTPPGPAIVPMGEAPPLETVKRESRPPEPTGELVNPPEIILSPREQVRRDRLFTAGTELDGLQSQLATLPDGPEKVAGLKRATDLVVELQALREEAQPKTPQGLGAVGSYPPTAEQLGTFQGRGSRLPANAPDQPVGGMTGVKPSSLTPVGIVREKIGSTPEKIGVVPPESLKAGTLATSPTEAAAKTTGWTHNPEAQIGGMNMAGLTPEQIAKLRTLMPAQWEFTDRRPGSKTEGITTYVPEGSTAEHIIAHIAAKTAEVEKGNNAPHPIPQPSGVQPEHLGVQQRQNVPENQSQVRQEKGPSPSDSGGLLGGKEKAEPLTEVQALAGGKITPEKEGEINSWLNQIAQKNGHDDVRFQLESQMASQPLDALLAHPQNKQVFDLLDKLAARHRIERELNPKPGGEEAHGAALIADRIVHLNPDNIAPDTYAHEISEIVLQDLLHSQNPADRELAARGLSIFHGDRERLVQALGRRETELAQLKVQGLTLKRFTEWWKDFVAHIKNVWGKGNEEDLSRLLARRILYGDYAVRNIPADAKTIHYQRIEKQMGEDTEAGRTVRNAVTFGTEPTLPRVRPLLDQIARTTKPELAAAGAKALQLDREYWGITNHVLAGVDALDGPHSLQRKEMEAASRYLYEKLDTRGQPTTTPSPKTLIFEQQFRDAAAQIVAETKKYNLMLQDQNGYRFIHETPYWMPEMFRGDVVDTMKRSPETAKAQHYEDVIVRHIADKKNMTVDDARAEWRQRYRDQILEGGNGKGQTAYGALELPHGIGVPQELREENLFRVAERYFNRAGKALAFHRTFRLDPVAGFLAGTTDQFGNHFPAPANRPDLTRPYGDVEDVQLFMKYLKGDYDSINRTVNAIGRVAKSFMMQTITGTADLVSYHAQVAPWVHPAQLDVFAKGVLNIQDGIKHAFDFGVIRKRSMAEAKLAAGTGYQGASAWVDRWNKLGDIINLVSGRDALERWTRGVTQSTMEALTYSNLGWLSNPEIGGSRKNSARRFMDQFAEPGWERQLETFQADPNGVPPEFVQRIAANATENVQGTYDPRDQPKYSLAGAGAPFLSLAKWNIGSLNRFTKNVIGPLKQGNPTPLIMSLGMGYLGGQAVSYIRQWLTGHKPQEATWDEVLQAGGEGLPYKLLAIASYSGFGGIATEFAKQGMDLKQGNSPQLLRWPALGFVENIGKRTGQAWSAMDAGENPVDVFGDFALQIAKDNIQIARIIAARTPQGQQTIERGNLARDVRTFRLLNGYPTSPMGGGMDTNPFLNPVAKQYERTQNFGEIAQMAPQLVQQAVERGGGDLEKTRALLSSYRGMGSDLIPSPKSTPEQFARFINFIGASQGDDAAQSVIQDFYRKNAMDHLKSNLIPSLR